MIKKSIIEAKFKRANCVYKSTFLWENAPVKIIDSVKIHLMFSENEQPVILFYKSESYILIITTQGIVILKRFSIQKFEYKNILKVLVKDIFSDNESKLENTNIDLILESGMEIKLKVEKGTWHIIFSIIQFCINNITK